MAIPNEVYLRTRNYLVTMVSARVADQTLSLAMKVNGFYPETVSVQHMMDLLKGPIYREFQLILPRDGLRRQLSALIDNLQSFARDEPAKTKVVKLWSPRAYLREEHEAAKLQMALYGTDPHVLLDNGTRAVLLRNLPISELSDEVSLRAKRPRKNLLPIVFEEETWPNPVILKILETLKAKEVSEKEARAKKLQLREAMSKQQEEQNLNKPTTLAQAALCAPGEPTKVGIETTQSKPEGDIFSLEASFSEVFNQLTPLSDAKPEIMVPLLTAAKVGLEPHLPITLPVNLPLHLPSKPAQVNLKNHLLVEQGVAPHSLAASTYKLADKPYTQQAKKNHMEKLKALALDFAQIENMVSVAVIEYLSSEPKLTLARGERYDWLSLIEKLRGLLKIRLKPKYLYLQAHYGHVFVLVLGDDVMILKGNHDLNIGVVLSLILKAEEST